VSSDGAKSLLVWSFSQKLFQPNVQAHVLDNSACRAARKIAWMAWDGNLGSVGGTIDIVVSAMPHKLQTDKFL
jgi:hypothetical protein